MTEMRYGTENESEFTMGYVLEVLPGCTWSRHDRAGLLLPEISTRQLR